MACASEADLLLFPKIKHFPLETFFISANRDLFLHGFIHNRAFNAVEWFIAPGSVEVHFI